MVFFLLRMLGDLASLGLPPAINNGPALRDWLLSLAEIASRASDRTESPLDDRLVDALSSIVANDDTWQKLYGIIELLAANEQQAYVAQLMQTKEVADKAEIDPITIVAIINAVIKIIELWRDRR